MKKSTLATVAGAGGSAVAVAAAGAPASAVWTAAAVGLLSPVVRRLLTIVEREHFARKSSAVRRDLLRWAELEKAETAPRPRSTGPGRR